MTTDFDHIVIGAGISGLGAAHFSARRGLSTLVLEASDRVGGCINSQHFDALGGFWTEGGGHTCFNSYGNMLSILDDLGLTGQVEEKLKVGYKLWKGGKRRSILSALHFFEAARSIPRLFTAPKDGRSVADYYGSVLGRRNYRDLLRYAFQAVICQPADDYPAEALFRRKPRRKEVIKAFTFAKGISTIPEAIAAQDAIQVRTGQRIARIESDAEGFLVHGEDGSQVRGRHLTLAVPPDVATALMPNGFEAARDTISDIGMSEIETLVLAFRNQDLPLKPIAGLIAVEDAFYSAVSRDFKPDDYRGFAFHFKPGQLSPEAQVERACTALGVAPDRIAAQSRIHNRLPALRSGHFDLVKRLDAALAGSRLAVTGNWFLGVSMEDALTRSRSESDRLFGT
ncbi:protoporphyrinogen/coproporphyrinogen oxidase [Imhoffiella purpurea]|uniref:Protoporphyrinogen IX oxidase, aerobic, HemY n=1 Tax=Imhoffiella purpurea TaxID=1249627 RepID=W9VUE4_9GAMM|nr:FAD-dependent oxidoreductase [Imhoffiella purpurea]EXJ13990.1 Protoporphyrinogen IX oxidase, aerobic, HemY [Imhoffiella purpurea]